MLKVSEKILFSTIIIFVFFACSKEKELILNNPENTPSYISNIVKNKGFVVIDFYADWCGPCKDFKPVFDKIAKDYKNKVEFSRINVDYSKDIAKKYDIIGIPTIVFLNNGVEIERIVGAIDEKNFKLKLKSNFRI